MATKIHKEDFPLIKELLLELTMTEVAEKWEVHLESLSRYLYRMGTTQRRIKDEHRRKVFIEAWRVGLSSKLIASKLGISASQMHRERKRLFGKDSNCSNYGNQENILK